MQRITVQSPGSFNKLKLESAPDLSPAPGEVLVETVGAGVNFADCVVRMGLYPSAKDYVGWPVTPGFEFSGIVRALGDGATEFAIGQQVYGAARFFAYATEVAVPEGQLRPYDELGGRLSLLEAAALPVAALTAWFALAEQGAARPGKKVLVHSAAGGVGSMMVQMARLLGCDVVAVVGSAAKVETLRQLGVAKVIDKSSERLFETARQHCPGGFDIICDANGVETLRGSYKALRPTGRLVVYGAHTMLTRGSGARNWLKLALNLLRTPRFDALDMTNANKNVLAFNLSYLFEESALLQRAFDQISAWVRAGELRIPSMTTFPLADAAEAQRALQSGTTVGKLVLSTQP